ncbi:hypothetical protein BV22DRAFT_878583 [Leucogyrophana mollusca]|uniref:Uncharacterized protein n=1 Tax=Leucogyrophana mollusca TaxID=85980 RepID=A0ACB8B113_9AGAM|nr:hypothetical protein BV22DRAFT_878583 [Leucogyrophana mollusca]
MFIPTAAAVALLVASVASAVPTDSSVTLDSAASGSFHLKLCSKPGLGGTCVAPHSQLAPHNVLGKGHCTECMPIKSRGRANNNQLGSGDGLYSFDFGGSPRTEFRLFPDSACTEGMLRECFSLWHLRQSDKNFLPNFLRGHYDAEQSWEDQCPFKHGQESAGRPVLLRALILQRENVASAFHSRQISIQIPKSVSSMIVVNPYESRM